MEVMALTLKDNIEYFPNVVLHSPLQYIQFADSNNQL
jgi:hypothetical protein